MKSKKKATPTKRTTRTKSTKRATTSTLTSRRGKKSKFNRAGHRSGLETKVATWLTDHGVAYKYEGKSLKYTIPAKEHKYTPDFWLDDNAFIEVKGKLDMATRKKMAQVRAEHPGMTMILCFGKPSNKLYKGSKTTYADWADQNGFLWCDTDTLELIIADRMQRKVG